MYLSQTVHSHFQLPAAVEGRPGSSVSPREVMGSNPTIRYLHGFQCWSLERGRAGPWQKGEGRDKAMISTKEYMEANDHILNVEAVPYLRFYNTDSNTEIEY